MKRKFRTLISCLLIASLCIGLLSATALAADPVGTEAPAAAETPAPSSGESTGTVEAPTVTEATKTETKSDTPAPGQTTTTTTTEKTWEGTTTEDGTTTTVNGEEKTTDTTVTAPDGDLLDQTGTVAGSETTTTTPGAGDPPKKPGTTDVADSKPDGSLEVTVTPGDTNVKAEGNVSVWLKNEAVPEWANDGSLRSEQGEDGTITNIVKKDDNTYTKTVTKPDGTVTVETVTLKKDDEGHVTGYTKTTETTGSVTDETVKPEVPDQATVGQDGDTTYSFELPEKPEITTPVQRDEAGKPVSGEEVLPLIDDRGSVIGYTKVTYTDGNPSYSDPVLGAYYATTTKIETLENGLQKITTTRTRVTDTKVLEEALSVSDGKWSLSGWMGDVKEGANNGDLRYNTPQPGKDQLDRMNQWEGHLGNVHTGEGSDQPWPPENRLKYSGYGLQSTVMIGYWKDNKFYRPGYVHQFRLIDSEGDPHYAYCADLSILAKADAEYELVNVLDSDYISDPDNRKYLQAIAEKGYWGTASGQGSLAAVKDLLDENSPYRDLIDDGIALAVTQAAIWTYGNRNGEKLGGNDFNKDGHTDRFLEFYYSGYDATTGEKFVSTFGDEQWNAAKELYNKLINLETSDAGTVTDIITKEDIKNATIRVSGKADTEGKYETELSFTLSVNPERINGKDGEDDVVLNIYNGDTLLRSHKLREAADASDSNGTFTVRYDQATGEAIYTVNGLEFTADTSVTLNLSGKQKLNGGAYLFRSDVNGNESQTFIGLVTGDSTRNLDLNVTLGFRVAEPIIEPAARASSRDKHTVTWTASYHTEWPHTPDQPPEEPEEPETPETPETPVAPAVPGYDVPKTGDASGLYYVLAIFSALGLALVTCAGRKRRTA